MNPPWICAQLGGVRSDRQRSSPIPITQKTLPKPPTLPPKASAHSHPRTHLIPEPRRRAVRCQ